MPTYLSTISWEDFGVATNASAARGWARAVRQLMLAGSIAPDSLSHLRLPQVPTLLR